MAWIKTIAPRDAKGRLKKIYDAAIKRAGRIFNIVSVQSLNPPVLDASLAVYMAAMFGPSPLSRAQREMLATVTSWANNCFY
ncbi:MAG: carboxymuconolactone decarboxylase family protein [Candidatus Acidiferrales bacterium]